MRKREFFIVILIILIGVLYNAYEEGEVDIFMLNHCSMNPKRIRDKGHPVNFPQEVLNFASAQTLDINNMAGEIKITPSSDGNLVIKPVIIVFHKNKKEAKRISRSIKLKSSQTNGKVEIFAGKKRSYPYKRARVNFNIQLPKGTSLGLYTRYGDIEITGASSPVYLNCRHGNITARRLDGPLKVHHRFGNAHIEDISQPLEINSQNSEMIIRDISSLKMHSSYTTIAITGVENETRFDYIAYSELDLKNSGKTIIEGRQTKMKLANISGGLTLKNSHNSVELRNIRGKLSMTTRNCKINMAEINANDLFLSNNHGRVNMEDISASQLETQIAHGDLDLSFIDIPGEINIINNNSDIMISYPQTVNPSYNIELKYGKIINKTGNKLTETTDQYMTRASKAGGTPMVLITNQYGDIILRNFTQKPKQTNVEPEEFENN